MALGGAPAGIDFNSHDGRPTKLVFLLLMPPRAHDQEVRILAQISRAVLDPQGRARLLEAQSVGEVVALISGTQPVPRMTSPGGSQARLAGG